MYFSVSSKADHDDTLLNAFQVAPHTATSFLRVKRGWGIGRFVKKLTGEYQEEKEETAERARALERNHEAQQRIDRLNR